MINSKKRFEILVVDDNKVNLQLLNDILTQEDYGVSVVESGETALSNVQTKVPDLILLDITMPNMDGYEVCRHLKSDPNTASVPIIFISGNYAVEDKLKGFRVGGIDYITKPFDNQEVLARVETHLQLNDYKNKLEERVSEEVNKNLQATNLMMHQSRLAQMGEMISMIAHQWRQPLSSIAATSMNMKVEIALGKSSQDSLNDGLVEIENLVEYLSHTIEDFRSFFRIDKEKETKRIVTLVGKALDIISSSLKSHNIEVLLDGPEEYEITTYFNELMQVILILLKNAEDVLVERKIEEPKIFISWSRKDDLYAICFHDNGGGITAENLPKVFDPYFSTKSQKNGTGLGLYMSHIIIDEHCKGDIEVKNEGSGAMFTITLPVSI